MRSRRQGRSVWAFLLFLLIPSFLTAQTFTTPLPGTLVRATAATGPEGRPGIALLVAANKDGKGAKTLLFLDPERRALTRLATGLHEEVNTVVGFDLSGAGSPAAAAPIAGMPGVLFTANGGGARKVLDEPNVDLRSVMGSFLGRPWIAAARSGLLELFGVVSGGGLTRQKTFPLPVKAERQRWGLRLTSPPVTLLTGEPALFAVGPQEVGRGRIQTLLLPADGEAFESWSRLPAGERLVSDRRYLRVDGAPALAATSFEKIGILARKRFRLFLLDRDRSRKGSGPTFSADTDCPLWFPLDPEAVDADGDGRQDLVLIHPSGMRGHEVIVSAYRGLGGGRFDPKPRRWKLDDEAWDWHYGRDLTGDGVPDLLLYVKNRLLLYPGDAKGPRPLAGRPAWSVAVTGAPNREVRVEVGDNPDAKSNGPGRDRLVQGFDLPGGSRAALAQGSQKDGKSVLTVVWRR